MNTCEIHELGQLNTASENEILMIWEEALRISHDFFNDCDREISIKKPRVREDLHQLVVICAYVENEIKGFAGVLGNELKMLYVHPKWQGQGIGRSLLSYSKQNFKIQYVDVYEQNKQAVDFYERMGFTCYGKTSKRDTTGKHLNVLRMKIALHD